MKAMPQIAFVLKGYPRLSETFIAQEIQSLMELDLDIAIYSLRHPTDSQTHPVHKQITAPVHYLPEYIRREPMRVLTSILNMLLYRHFYIALKQLWKDFLRDKTRNRLRRFGQAIVLAAELPPQTRLIHAHFLHTPASVARYAAIIRNLPWTCSAHAKDIWTSPEWEIREKLAHCQWLTTCTAANATYLRGLSKPEKVFLNYHGLDLARFSPAHRIQNERIGLHVNSTVYLLSIGRAVSKKGYASLLTALSKLPKTLFWRFDHIGGGDLLDDLKNQAQDLGISDKCFWLDAQTQEAVLHAYRQADIFVLNSQVDENGDRDGLPNVIVEAQSQALPVLATKISGIPELITNGENGILVEQRDTQSLTQALQELITRPSLRYQLGIQGEQIVRKQFDKNQCIDALYQQFCK